MIRYVTGDVRDIINKNSFTLIPHCCNDIGVMGAGVAKAIKEKWPIVWENYAANSNHLYLGRADFINVEDKTVVVNMIGQKGINKNKKQMPPVRYSGLCSAMFKVANFIKLGLIADKNYKNITIQCPVFGCDLAGGKWEFVSTLIEEIWCTLERTKVVCVIHESSIDKFGYLLESKT